MAEYWSTAYLLTRKMRQPYKPLSIGMRTGSRSCSRSLEVMDHTTLRSIPCASHILAAEQPKSQPAAPLNRVIALIGISGIEADGTLRDFDFREVKVSQTIIAHAREVWVAADSSKFNRPAMVEVAKLSQIDRLFTDAPPPDPFPDLLTDAQVRYTVASSTAAPSTPKVNP
jgi:hypothetical protein